MNFIWIFQITQNVYLMDLLIIGKNVKFINKYDNSRLTCYWQQNQYQGVTKPI